VGVGGDGGRDCGCGVDGVFRWRGCGLSWWYAPTWREGSATWGARGGVRWAEVVGLPPPPSPPVPSTHSRPHPYPPPLPAPPTPPPTHHHPDRPLLAVVVGRCTLPHGRRGGLSGGGSGGRKRRGRGELGGDGRGKVEGNGVGGAVFVERCGGGWKKVGWVERGLQELVSEVVSFRCLLRWRLESAPRRRRPSRGHRKSPGHRLQRRSLLKSSETMLRKWGQRKLTLPRGPTENITREAPPGLHFSEKRN